MAKNNTIQTLKYIAGDLFSAGSAYTLLYIYRKTVIEPGRFGEPVAYTLQEPKYYLGLALICIFWIAIYTLTAYYQDIYRRSRLKELIYTFNASLLGSIFIFFALMLDDWVNTYTDYYRGFLVYFSAHFLLTVFFRLAQSTITAYRIRRGSVSFKTIIIGSNSNAADLYLEMEQNSKRTGHEFVGFVSVHNNIRFLLEKNLEHLGNHNNLTAIIKEHGIEEVVIAIESSEHEKLEEIINILEDVDVKIMMIPDTYDIISGKVRLNSFSSAPLVEIQHQLMPLWQAVVKRVMDIVVSSLLLVLFSPIFLFCVIMIKLTDRGPIFFRQTRIGFAAKPFDMIKFRSMSINAEENGPQLSSENDPRITKWGKIMRKYRLDELPQFVNVVKGDMSIVGPRPERKYYIEKITEKAPHYKHLHKVKPGITSWGMVKFGYAENVDEMVKRLKYDIIYIENMNLFNDIKILIYTVLIVLQGRGK